MVELVLFDTNILIDILNGIPASRDVYEQFPNPGISVISWMEVMAGTPATEEAKVARFLDQFAHFSLAEGVIGEAVRIRRQSRIKLPDAIILATARVHGRVLLTRNTRDFDVSDVMVRIPYSL